MTPDARLAPAIQRFNALNETDPRQVTVNGVARPYELVQAERLEAWVLRLAPEASDALRLAARCQHLLRFRIPRNTYPADRIGYLKWRKDLARFHAAEAARVMTEVGVAPDVRAQVQKIQLKQELKQDPETQTMEDALCLSFLEHELEAFAQAHEDTKVIDIIQKTWRKMSKSGHEHARELGLCGRALALVLQALSPAASEEG